LSLEHGHRVRLKVGLAEDDATAPSLVPIHPTANWLEREVFDFYGVIFEGHPDLRRIIMPDDWEGHPLRKDYALGGVGTRYHGAFIPPVEERNA
jgi:NADH-quinone oxidoreductase subunit C